MSIEVLFEQTSGDTTLLATRVDDTDGDKLLEVWIIDRGQKIRAFRFNANWIPEENIEWLGRVLAHEGHQLYLCAKELKRQAICDKWDAFLKEMSRI